jgi:hypothetical protein
MATPIVTWLALLCLLVSFGVQPADSVISKRMQVFIHFLIDRFISEW